MARLPALSALLLVTACRSTGPAPDVTTTQVTTTIGIATGGTVGLRRTAEEVGHSTDLRIRPDSAFRLLRAVYADLQFVPGRIDRSTREVAVTAAKVRRRLAGVSLTRYLDCGSKDNLPNAETYDIELSVLSQVSVNADSTSRVTTRIHAVASDPFHGAGNQTTCTTLGALEARIADGVKLRAGLR